MKKHTYSEIEKARKILAESGHFVQNLWHKADVDELCKQKGVKKIKDIQDFFDYVSRKHDAEIGVNWDSLSYYIDSYLEDETSIF